MKKIIAVFAVVSAIVGLALSTPATASEDALKLAWTAETGGSINLAPVVAGGRVLVIPKGGPLVALDKASGKVQWKYAPREGLWHRSLGSDGQRVYACLEGGELAALNITDGKLLWKIDLGIDCQRQPRVVGKTLLVATTFVGSGLPSNIFTGAKLYSINAADGRVNWSFTSDNYLLQTPFQKGNTIYLGGNFRDEFRIDEGGHNRIYALDSKTGQPKWQYESQLGIPKALYATKDRLAYVGYQDYLVGIDTATGKQVWKRDTGNWVPSLSGKGNVVYYGSANTMVYAWNMTDGKTVWNFNIPGKSFNYLMGTPVFEGERLYFLSQRGAVYALNREDGKEIFSQQTEVSSRTGLSVSDRMVYMGDMKGRVYAYRVLK